MRRALTPFRRPRLGRPPVPWLAGRRSLILPFVAALLLLLLVHPLRYLAGADDSRLAGSRPGGVSARPAPGGQPALVEGTPGAAVGIDPHEDTDAIGTGAATSGGVIETVPNGASVIAGNLATTAPTGAAVSMDSTATPTTTAVGTTDGTAHAPPIAPATTIASTNPSAAAAATTGAASGATTRSGGSGSATTGDGSEHVDEPPEVHYGSTSSTSTAPPTTIVAATATATATATTSPAATTPAVETTAPPLLELPGDTSFGTDSAALSDTGRAEIDAFADRLGDAAPALRVECWADDRGTVAHNAALSADRCAAVKAELDAARDARGRPPLPITLIAHGETDPPDPSCTGDCEQNRIVRVMDDG